MSLRVRKIANSMTVAVNENTDAILKVSEGYTIASDGSQISKYTTQEKVLQTQSMDVEDLAHLGFANQQGQFMLAYADGMIPAIRRGLQLGTTMVILKPYGEDMATIWQVKKVVESYNDWVKILIQNTGKPYTPEKAQLDKISMELSEILGVPYIDENLDRPIENDGDQLDSISNELDVILGEKID